MDDEGIALVRAAAARHGVSSSYFMRMSAIAAAAGEIPEGYRTTNSPPRRVPRRQAQETTAAIGELGKLASNVNQIARHLNRAALHDEFERNAALGILNLADELWLLVSRCGGTVPAEVAARLEVREGS